MKTSCTIAPSARLSDADEPDDGDDYALADGTLFPITSEKKSPKTTCSAIRAP